MSAEALVKVYPRLRLYARSLTRNRDAAEDLLQSTAVRVLSSLHQFRPGGNFDAWSFRLMRNLFISDLRKSANKPHLDISEPLLTDGRLRVDPVEPGDGAHILRSFRELPREQRDPILLYGLEGMSVGDISEALGVPKGTVKSRMSRGRAAVAADLDMDARRTTP